jgi:hydroxylamine reductase
MFCYQCQEASKGTGCTIAGVCGKKPETAGLQDLLIYTAKGISLYADKLAQQGKNHDEANHYVMESLFITITNANFDDARIKQQINQGIALRKKLQTDAGWVADHDAANWELSENKYLIKALSIGILSPKMKTSFIRELLVYGIKGMAAYGIMPGSLGYKQDEVFAFMHKGISCYVE